MQYQPTLLDDLAEWWDEQPHWAQWAMEAALIAGAAALMIVALPVGLTVAGIAASSVVAGGAALAIAGRGAYHLGAWGQDNGMSSNWARGLQAGGTVATNLGVMAMTLPVMAVSTGALYARATLGAKIGLNVLGAASGLAYAGYAGYGMYRTVRDIRAGKADWYDFAERHGHEFVTVPLALYGSYRAIKAALSAYRSWQEIRHLRSRVGQLHDALKKTTDTEDIARTMRVTAIVEAQDLKGKISYVVGSSRPNLDPAQRKILLPGEWPASGKGHAEVTALKGIPKNMFIGNRPGRIAVSDPICPDCAQAIFDAQAIPVTPLRADAVALALPFASPIPHPPLPMILPSLSSVAVTRILLGRPGRR